MFFTFRKASNGNLGSAKTFSRVVPEYSLLGDRTWELQNHD
jgi:hypothetical protein